MRLCKADKEIGEPSKTVSGEQVNTIAADWRGDRSETYGKSKFKCGSSSELPILRYIDIGVRFAFRPPLDRWWNGGANFAKAIPKAAAASPCWSQGSSFG